MEKLSAPLDSPEREWFLDNRLRALDHVVSVDTSVAITFKNKKGKVDALFPDELEAMKFRVGQTLFEDCDEQGEGQYAGEIMAGCKTYDGGDNNGQG